ncbi:ABC transporter permease [Bacillus paranthracis]|uniref:FtsX-like permease family protein n=3 Tax=Bacillus cereus group TaxID=86661 RepID=UPI000200FAF9|nr:ABC transporter permease [Bacillus paranthracis]ADY22259.1 ABC transporter, permease protein [Bacillus thuringiensis serovar finitimus YBT-020]MRC71091.1 FtsX-like permease family protein [Bacillus thuringiensis]OTX69773.1 ABC transporter permease [Bacillus thuringiensis serovar finitimus]MCR6797541.1 ABC transporter permease [Bacillus paranthracis]MEC3355685.1 ABC transporter permease [Bacillus paranthracis]
MNLVIKEIVVNKAIFIMLFIAFVLTIWPILIAMSTKDYYDERFYDSKNGYFNYYYSVQLTNMGEFNFKQFQTLVESDFKNASVITNDIRTTIPGIGRVTMNGLLNKNWSPPLLKGSQIEQHEENSVIVGKKIYKNTETIKLFNKEYTVKGVAGVNTEYEYNMKIYVSLNDMPDEVKQVIQNEKTFQMIVRSNENPKEEIETFIQHLKQNNTDIKAKVISEKENYEKEKNTSKAVKELLSFPFRLFCIAFITSIIVSYYWIYTKKKNLSLRKALGASNVNLFIFIFSQLFLCAIAASTCAICIQWIFSTLSGNILEFTSYSISLQSTHIVMCVFLSLTIAFILSVIPFVYVIKSEPAKALKE